MYKFIVHSTPNTFYQSRKDHLRRPFDLQLSLLNTPKCQPQSRYLTSNQERCEFHPGEKITASYFPAAGCVEARQAVTCPAWLRSHTGLVTERPKRPKKQSTQTTGALRLLHTSLFMLCQENAIRKQNKKAHSPPRRIGRLLEKDAFKKI